MISSYRPFYNWSEIFTLLRFGSGRSHFEAAMAERVGTRHALAFSYARAGMIALFKTFGLDQAEIVMPAYTCSSVIEAVIHSGNTPVFVDISLTDYNLDLSRLKSVVTSRTGAIIATHMFGYPVDVAAIRQTLGDDKIPIVEDAALALPTRHAQSEAAVYSLGRGKQLYTISGGVVATNSTGLYQQLKAYRDQEMNRLPGSVRARRMMQIGTAFLAQNGQLEEKIIKLKKVGVVQQARESAGLVRKKIPPDYGAPFTDFQGRIGLAQLKKLDTGLTRARTRAQFYYQALQDIPGVTPPPLIPQATYAYYSVRIAGRDALDFPQRMHERGIEVGRNFNYALPYLEAYQKYAKTSYPNAEQTAREIVNLPNYPGLTAQEAHFIVESMSQILKEQYDRV